MEDHYQAADGIPVNHRGERLGGIQPPGFERDAASPARARLN
jgi:hypothetical protein